jgi:uncharacterized protein (UPF0210 family)
MDYSQSEILETIRMTEMEHLDIRTVTMGISLRDCADSSIAAVCDKVYRKILRYSSRLVSITDEIASEYGISIANRRIAITPAALVAESSVDADYVALAHALDRAANEVGVDFIGGFSALVHKGMSRGDELYLESIPDALSTTSRLCGSINVATTRAGINLTAVARVSQKIKDLAERTADRGGLGCAKFVVFANAGRGQPFHGRRLSRNRRARGSRQCRSLGTWSRGPRREGRRRLRFDDPGRRHQARCVQDHTRR